MDNYSEHGDTQDQDIQIWPQEYCRFAYTLNNQQPVRCTWISDQPLFYTDYDDASDEDLAYDDPIIMALEKDIADLREKTLAYDQEIGASNITEMDKLALFSSDADFITHPYAKSYDLTHRDYLLSVMHESRLGSQYLSMAQLYGVKIELSNQVSEASYDRDTQTILIRADMNEIDQLLLISRELRRMIQHRSGVGLHPLTLNPDFAILINRAQIADLAVSMIRVAWELQLSNRRDVWERIEHSPLCDLGRAFAREAIADFRSIQDGTAARMTFESWFLSERCRRADRQLIQQMLADYRGYSFSDNTEASRFIALDILRKLGDMPFSSNYTENLAAQIMVDPIFTEVRDRSNANFLWFIKFERAFTEAEKSTISAEATEAVNVTAQILSFPKVNYTRDTLDPAILNETSAEIFVIPSVLKT